MPKIKFRARKLQLDWWYVTQCLQQKPQGLQRVGKKLVLVSPLPPPSTVGAAWQPVPWINQRCQTSRPVCQSCRRLLSQAHWACSAQPEPLTSPRADPVCWTDLPSYQLGPALWWQFLPEKPREAKEKATRKQQQTWRSPRPRNLPVPPRSPRKLQPRSGAWRKAAAASVAKKTTYSPQKVKTVKPKRTAKRLPKSNVVRPRLPGLRWEGWEGNARGRVKPLRGDDGAHLSKPDPWLWEGGEPPSGLCRRQPAGGTRCVALWRCPPCPVASCHVPRRMVQWHVARHGGPKIRVPRALPLSDAVFTQTTEILASPH